MILDAHTHVEESPLAPWHDPPEKLLPLLDAAGIEQAVVMTYLDCPIPAADGVEYIAQVARKYPRLIPFARMNPIAGEHAVSIFTSSVRELGIRGLKLHGISSAHPTNPKTLELVAAAAKLRVPVLFHSGDEDRGLPLQIAGVCEACPDAVVILGHMGGYYHVRDAIAVAARHPNAYLETSATPDPSSIREAVDRIGSSRVLFGSDGPGAPPALELEKVRMAGLSSRDLELVLGINATRLLSGGA
jgi:uncharacterized protein